MSNENTKNTQTQVKNEVDGKQQEQVQNQSGKDGLFPGDAFEIDPADFDRWLNYENLRIQITMKAGYPVSENDPLLLIIPILKSFIQAQGYAQQKRGQILFDAIKNATSEHVAKVDSVTQSLAETLKSSQVDAIKSMFKEQNEISKKMFISRLTIEGILTVICAISAITVFFVKH